MRGKRRSRSWYKQIFIWKEEKIQDADGWRRCNKYEKSSQSVNHKNLSALCDETAASSSATSTPFHFLFFLMTFTLFTYENFFLRSKVLVELLALNR